MSGHSKEEIQKHVRTYLVVFVALGALTAVTVGVSYLHLPIHLAVIVALFVASIKGFLVAAYFMHLISEKKIIGLILLMTALFFLLLLIIPAIFHH